MINENVRITFTIAMSITANLNKFQRVGINKSIKQRRRKMRRESSRTVYKKKRIK